MIGFLCDACCVCKHEGNDMKTNCFVLYQDCLAILNRGVRQRATSRSEGTGNFLPLQRWQMHPLQPRFQTYRISLEQAWIISSKWRTTSHSNPKKGWDKEIMYLVCRHLLHSEPALLFPGYGTKGFGDFSNYSFIVISIHTHVFVAIWHTLWSGWWLFFINSFDHW